MKILYLLISLIIVFIVAFLIVTNLNSITDLTIISPNFAEILKISSKTLSINTALLIGICYIIGKLSMFLCLLPRIQKSKEKEGAYERRLEKTSVSNDESTARIKVLEAKIKVLEKALEDSLKKK